MKEVTGFFGSVAIVLAVVATSIFALHDRTTLVSPAEAVAEDFVRALTTGRYNVAMRYVDPRAGVSRDAIQTWSDQLRSQGSVQSVDVTPVASDRDSAITNYVVTLASGQEITGELRLIFDREWLVTR
jgi:hypothetical protein